MPEGYTHVRTARRAAEALHIELACPAAFAAGANGPDALFCYQILKSPRKRLYDLPGLGARMHEEKTGAFLRCLTAGLTTRAQLEYALGFLSHYAADAVVHPYVAALCEPGMPYAGPGGHGCLEIALDSTLHAADTGVAAVPAADTSPLMKGPELAEVATLLHGALRGAYGEEVPVEYLADAFYELYRVRRHFVARTPFKRGALAMLELFVGGRGFITAHLSPRQLKKDLPDRWINPFTGETCQGNAFALLQEAQKRSEMYMTALLGWQMGRLPREKLVELLGSASYTQGIETADSRGADETPAPV